MIFSDHKVSQGGTFATWLVAKHRIFICATSTYAMHHVAAGDNLLFLKSQTNNLGFPEGIP